MDNQEKTTAAFFDVDGTLTSGRTWAGFLEYYRLNGLKRATRYFYFGYHYPLYFLRRLGLISEGRFRAPWAANMAWFVRGDTIQDAKKAWDYTIDYLEKFWRQDTIAILNHHKENGDLVVLVSSGPLPLLQRTGDKLGADHVIGTAFEVLNGRYTGRSLKPTCIDSYKATMTQEFLANAGYDIDYPNSYSYADSMADMHMLEMVGNPTAVYADYSLKVLARERGWKLYPPESEDKQ